MVKEKIKKFEKELLKDQVRICELVYQESDSKIKITKLGYFDIWRGLREGFIDFWDHLDYNFCPRINLEILIKNIMWINIFDKSSHDPENKYPLGEPVEIKHIYEGEGFGFEVVYLKNRNKVVEQFRENKDESKKIVFYKPPKEGLKEELISREIIDLTPLRIIKTISGPFYELKGIEDKILSFSYKG